jgi:hypothetical protein
MPIIICEHCDVEFHSTLQCEEHEMHCVYNPNSVEHAVAERMKHFGMDYQASLTAYENEQRLLKKWVNNVSECEVKNEYD